MLFRLNFLFLRGVSRKRNGSELFSVFVVSVSPCPFVFTAFSSLSLFFPPILDLSPKLMLLLRGLAQMPSRGLFPTALFDGSVIQCLYGSELRNRLGTLGRNLDEVDMATKHQPNSFMPVQLHGW